MTLKRLGVGSILGDILDRFHFASTSRTTQKMALYGSHDTTVAAILSTLGVFDRRWPQFTSNVTFELFKAQRGGILSFVKKDQHYVRVRYNQDVVKLPGTRPVWGEI